MPRLPLLDTRPTKLVAFDLEVLSSKASEVGEDRILDAPYA